MIFQRFQKGSNPPSRIMATFEYLKDYIEPVLMLLSSSCCLVLVSVTLRWVRLWERDELGARKMVAERSPGLS